MKNKTIYTINSVLLGLLVIADILYIILGRAYIFKTLASSVFVVIALFNLVISLVKTKENTLYKYLMFVGILFAFMGDILLIDYFILGAIFFGIGHVFYFVAFCFIKKVNWLDAIFFAVILGFALGVIFGYKHFNFNGMLAVVVCYALIISLMLGKATANSRAQDKNKLVTNLIWLGALLFFISDMFLLFSVFGGAPKVADILCLATYYPAQGLLATSILYVNYVNAVNKANNKNEQLQKSKENN